MPHPHGLGSSCGASVANTGLHIAPLGEHNRTALEARAREKCVLAQHHPVWVDIFREMGEDCRGLVAIERERVVDWVLYTVRSAHHGTLINSMPFTLYGGPAMPGGHTAALVSLMQALRAEARRLEADILTVGTSPWLPDNIVGAYRRALGTTHDFANFVQLQDLQPHPLQQLTRKRRGAIRSEIKKAASAGLRVLPKLTSSQFGDWLTIYKTRYSEIGATPYPDAFHRLAFEIGVPAGAVEFWGVAEGQRLVGGSMFLIATDTADYFSSAFLTSYRQLYPNSLLLTEVFKNLAERGIRHLNWQSSPGRGGVYKYKARWGARESSHHYLSTLLNPDSQLLQTAVPDVRDAFPFRFVLPYSAWPSLADGE